MKLNRQTNSPVPNTVKAIGHIGLYLFIVSWLHLR